MVWADSPVCTEMDKLQLGGTQWKEAVKRYGFVGETCEGSVGDGRSGAEIVAQQKRRKKLRNQTAKGYLQQ